ncbi:hypothetical protein [Bradyrhizobium liaoningense]
MLIKAKPLAEFMAVGGYALYRKFDLTRFLPGSFTHWDNAERHFEEPDLRAGPGCLDSAPLDLSGFLPGYAERGALRFCRCVGRA